MWLTELYGDTVCLDASPGGVDPQAAHHDGGGVGPVRGGDQRGRRSGAPATGRPVGAIDPAIIRLGREHHPDHPYIVYNDAPKLVHLKQLFPALYKGG